MNRVGWILLIALLLSLSSNFVIFNSKALNEITDDRLTILTGARTEVERLNVCSQIIGVDSVQLRTLRNSTETPKLIKGLNKIISEKDDFAISFLKILRKRDEKEVIQAQHTLDKKFTSSEMSVLVKKYSSVLTAHCEGVLKDSQHSS
jgi:hypothetical protein